MNTKQENKTTAHYVIREVGTNRYRSINYEYSDTGCAIPCDLGKNQVDRFTKSVLANNAIKRTYDAKYKVRGSMLEGWPKMAPLMKSGALEVEEVIEQP